MADTPSARPARRIAIIRLTSLGDVVHTLPVAAALRQHEPTARIIWLVEEREQVLLRGNAAVDDVLLVPLRRWREQLTTSAGRREIRREAGALTQALRDLKIDVALDVQGWPHKTSPLVWLTHAPMRVGFDWHYARHPLSTLATNVHVTPPPSARHVVDQNLSLLGPLGITAPGDAQFPLPPFPEADARAEAWLREHEAIARRRVALLPATRGQAKHWPVESYREVARRLLAAGDTTVFILGGPGEEARLEQVRGDLPPDRAVMWAGGPIPDLTAILRRMDLAIGNDTGPLHLAVMHDVPSLGLFGPTRGQRNGPYGRAGSFLQSPTGRMRDISVDEVMAAVARVTTTASRPKAATR
ncbi:MAG TPA: glycosyltransferase family 9 protein [Vicinamibacterales bacterium]|nr:glycosyltransferase family 9 protein [Vicinamibacterales bacterium]